MRILELETKPIAELAFLNAGRGPGQYYEDILPVELAWVDQLPDGVVAIVVTSDLQGREHFKHQTGPQLRLLGEWLPQLLAESILPELSLPAGRIGVFLAGDFYTVPALDKRGGSGDVTSVWQAFGQHFSWVVGVAGNHDTFGDHAKPPNFREPLHFLDKSSVNVDGLTIAGISGIVGNLDKPWRKSEEEFEEYIFSLQSAEPDVVLMHDGPGIPELGYRGSSRMLEAVSFLSKPLIIRGHAHWKQALAELPTGLQILNVDARVVILQSSRVRSS